MGVRTFKVICALAWALAAMACGGGDEAGADTSSGFPVADVAADGSLFVPDDTGATPTDITPQPEILADGTSDGTPSPDAVGPTLDTSLDTAADSADGGADAVEPPQDVSEPEPDATNPDTSEPDATEPTPDVVEPEEDIAEPDATEPTPDIVEPEPDATEPEEDIVEPEPEPEPEYNLCGVGKDAQRPPGTWEEPIDAPFSPFVDEGDTALSPSDEATHYDCKPETLEYGPETVYRFTTQHAGDFRAEVVDGVGVDIDLHLLQDPEIGADGLVTGCLARAHELLIYEDLPPGDYWLVADSWTSASSLEEYPGAYRIAWEVVSPNVWTEVTVREGVTWSRARLETGGEVQTVNVLRFDPSTGWDLQPNKHSGCKTVSQAMETIDAFAGVNANFYDSCAPTDLLKEDGVLHTTNQTTSFEQRTIGWNDPTNIQFQWIAPGLDWPEVSNAVGGYPSLVDSGQALAAVKPGEQVWSATDWAQNPRTVVGVDSNGALVMATFDGRTDAGDGYSTPALATWVAQELDLVHAINLDGGGSTTMVVRDCWMNHTVSYPSDNEIDDHEGLRAVASGLYLR